MYKQIVNPATGRKVNVDGKIGKQVLQQYKEQLGGFNFGFKFGRNSNKPQPKVMGPEERAQMDQLIERGVRDVSLDYAELQEDYKLLKSAVKVTIDNLPEIRGKKYFIIEKKNKNYNLNKDCYEELTNEEKDHFFEVFKKKQKEAKANIDTDQPFFIKRLFDLFNVVKLKDGNQGVIGKDCSTSHTAAGSKWVSRNIAPKLHSTGQNIVQSGKNIGKGVKYAFQHDWREHDWKKTRDTTKQKLRTGATSLYNTAAKGTKALYNTAAEGTSSVYNSSIGKNNYIKSLIREIKATDDVQQRQQKLLKLKKIDKKYVVLLKTGDLDLPKKNIDCQVKTILKNDRDNKLIEVCSCNGVDIDLPLEDLDEEEKSRHAKSVARNKRFAQGNRTTTTAAPIHMVLDESGFVPESQEGGGKRRNAKRTSKKRNASKKRRNTSKNNNRR